MRSLSGVPGTAFLPSGVPHAWKNTGTETGRVPFRYTQAGAGGFFEEQLGRPAGVGQWTRELIEVQDRRSNLGDKQPTNRLADETRGAGDQHLHYLIANAWRPRLRGYPSSHDRVSSGDRGRPRRPTRQGNRAPPAGRVGVLC